MDDIRECKTCFIDFIPDSDSQKHCRTKACVRDRSHAARDRFAKKVKKDIGYVTIYGKDPTTIRPNGWQNGGGRKKSSE